MIDGPETVTLARSIRLALCPLASVAAIGFAPAPAHADLKLCNTTSSRVGVAIGYRDVEGWASGRLVERRLAYLRDPAQGCANCQVLLHPRYRLRSRRGMGRHLVHVYRRQAFTIRDVKECVKRGYKRTGFFEVDTGEERDWTVRLTDPEGEAKSQ